MPPFTFYIPTKIRFGNGELTQLPLECPPDAAERIMLVCDSDRSRISGALEACCRLLSDRDLIIYDRILDIPSYEIIDEGAELAQSQSADLILGIGSGDALDAAKGIAVACQQSKQIRAYAEGRELDELPLPIICIPTTAGSGSEATPFALFSDDKKQTLVHFETDHIFPTLAIIDPRFSRTEPENEIVSAALDALTNAIEALFSTHPCPIAETMAQEAISLIATHLPAALEKDPEARDQLSHAALLSGLALSQKSTIILHHMAFPLTKRHHVPYGLAKALLLPSLLDFIRLEKQCLPKNAFIDSAFKASGGLGSFLTSLGIGPSMAQYGIKEESLTLYANQTLAKGNLATTPARVDKEKLIEIYKAGL